MVKSLSAVQETRVQSLGWEDPLEKGMATTPVFLPGELHGQRSLVGYRAWGLRVRCDWAKCFDLWPFGLENWSLSERGKMCVLFNIWQARASQRARDKWTKNLLHSQPPKYILKQWDTTFKVQNVSLVFVAVKWEFLLLTNVVEWVLL